MAGRLPEPGVPRDEALQLNPALMRAAAGVAGFACTGLLAAGFMNAAPAGLRVAAALTGLVVAPALTTLRAWGRATGERGWTIVALPASLLGVISVHALIAAVFTLLDAPFSVYSSATIWLSLLWCGAAIARGLRAGRHPVLAPLLPWKRIVLSSTLLVALAVLVPPHYTGAEDAYDHIGYVRRVMLLDAMRPDGVLAMPADAAPLSPDPRKGAFHDLVAVTADLAGADPVDTWGWLRLLMYPLAVLAFAGFSGVFVTGGAFIACMVLFFLSYPGTTFQLVNTAAYGQSLAVIWFWMLAGLVLRGFGSRGRQFLLLAVTVAAGVAVHLGVALHVLLLAVSLVALGAWAGMARRDAWRAAAWMVLGAGVGMVLRGAHGSGHANEIHAHLQGVMTVARGQFVVSPMEILREYGLVFLAGIAVLPLTAVAARRDRRARRVLALSVLPLLLAFLPPLATFVFHHASYMSMRSLLNVPAFAGVVVTVSWLVCAARARGVVARAAAAAVLLFLALRFLNPTLGAFAADLRGVAPRGSHVADRMDQVVAGLPAGATLLSDPVTAYRLSAYTSHRFVAILQQHANPLDPFALDRLQAVRDCLSPFAPAPAAAAACRRYGVDFVVVSRRPPGVSTAYLTPGYPGLYAPSLARLRSMPGSFREFARGETFVVLSFDPRPEGSNDFDGIPAPVLPDTTRVTPCRITVPRDRFEVTGVDVTPARIAPGDSVDVVLGYRRDRVTSYGAGVMFHVRFDHETVSGSASFPGDKYLRRARERRNAERLRFRADLRAGHGVYEPDLWPMGTPLVERFRVAIPAGAAPGRYQVEIRAVEESLVPNFDIRDLLFNRDHYSGNRCATIEVRAAEVPE